MKILIEVPLTKYEEIEKSLGIYLFMDEETAISGKQNIWIAFKGVEFILTPKLKGRSGAKPKQMKVQTKRNRKANPTS